MEAEAVDFRRVNSAATLMQEHAKSKSLAGGNAAEGDASTTAAKGRGAGDGDEPGVGMLSAAAVLAVAVKAVLVVHA